jgi:hypothetical protein
MAMTLSEKTTQMANDGNFQKRIYYFYLQQSATDTADVQRWVYNNGPNNTSAYMIVCADPSVRDAINPIDPWLIETANAAVTDGMLAAAVNAQWSRIKQAGSAPQEAPQP